MRDHLCLVLVLLVVTTSLNSGQKIKNERRASGLVAYPRVGRTTGMTNFARTDRAMGLVSQARIGRSGAPPNVIHELDPDVEADFVEEANADVDLDIILDTDYQVPLSVQSSDSQGEARIQDINTFQEIHGLIPIPRIGRSETTEDKHSKISLAKSAIWFGLRPVRSGHKGHNQERRYNGLFRLPWTVFFSPRELTGLQQHSHHQEGFALDREFDASREKLPALM